MQKPKVHLWNSMMGKVYSASDSFLDNGLAILKAACLENGVQVTVDDPADIAFMTRFIQDPPSGQRDKTLSMGRISRELKGLMPRVFRPEPSPEDLAAWDALQQRANGLIEARMESYLQDLSDAIAKGSHHILGVKTWLGKRHIHAERLAQLVQEKAPETVVIAGGPQVNQFQEHSLIGNRFDLGIYSEGENTLAALAKLIAQLRAQGLKKPEILEAIAAQAEAGRIPNLVYRKNGGTAKTGQRFASLNKLPLPAYDLHPGKMNVAVVVDDLGCYYKKGCAFCAHKKSVGGFRTRKVAPLIGEIRSLIKQDVGLFRFSSSATSAVKGYKIAREILDQGLVLEFSMFTRGEAQARQGYLELVYLYKTMIQAGMRAVFLGVEAANQQVLDQVMEKGNSVEDIFYTILALKEASARTGVHLDVGLSFVYPCPLPPGLDSPGLMEDNMDFLEKLREKGCRVDSILVTPAGPIPGSRWFENQRAFGFDLDPDFLQTYMRYNYELGKDPKTWPDIGIRLEGKSFKEMLAESGRFGQRLEQEGYAVNLTDEHCLCARASGFKGREGLERFKKLSDQAILCLDYGFLEATAKAVNARSRKLARQNNFHPSFGQSQPEPGVLDKCA